MRTQPWHPRAKRLGFISIAILVTWFTLGQSFGSSAYAQGFTAPLAAPPPIALQLVAATTSLHNIVSIAHPEDGTNRLFFVRQDGQILIYDGQLLSQPFLNISSLIACCTERGLLGLAFHPDYASNGLFYVDYTNTSGSITIARYSVSADPNVANAASAAVLLTVSHPNGNHNGGQLAFGNDGYLYIGVGDGGGGGDPDNNGQNLNTLLGKILRIDVDNGSPYGIPIDNPFLEQPTDNPNTRAEIWAYGLRNPWRFSFDRETHDLWIADVGQGSREEADLQLAGNTGGQNYGWRLMEGNACFNPAINCNDGSLTLPVIEYQHTNGNCSITGGFRYRGDYAALVGTYLYADLCTGRIWGAVPGAGASWDSTELLDTSFTISTFGEDRLGRVYVTSYGDSAGAIYRIVDPNILFARADFDGDKISDPALYYNNGTWSWLTSSSGFSSVITSPAFNTGGGVTPLLGNDFDGDDKIDPTVYHPGWGLLDWRRSSDGGTGQFGYFTSTANPVAISANDYDGDGKSDPALFYPTNGVWSWKNSSTNTDGFAAFNATGSPTPVENADVNGDGKSDPALFYSGTGLFAWNVNGSAGTAAFNPSGHPEPFLSDFDGDGKSDPAVYYQDWALWAWKRSTDEQIDTAPFNPDGGPQPVVGYFDNDNQADAGIYYATWGLWAWKRSIDGVIDLAAYNPGGNPEPQMGYDFDGDGKSDPALYYRTWGLWAWKESLTGTAQIAAYNPGGNPVAVGGLDFDGDGKAEPALYHRDWGLWVWKRSSDGTVITKNMNSNGVAGPVR